MLPVQHRLRTSAEFAATLRGRGTARAASRLLVVHAAMTDPGHAPRVGFVVSKAVGNAVVRNRTKRRLRHIAAASLDRLPAGVSIVVRANPASAQAPFTELDAELTRLVDKATARLAA